MKTGWVKVIFLISGVYDAILGVIFLLVGNQIYDLFGVTRPNHIGYIQFPALLLIVFGIMFLRIAADPVRFRELIWYGVALKIAFAGVVFYHLLTHGIPSMWVPFAIADIIFFILFVVCWTAVGKFRSSTP
jgi:hypothetical protein